MRDSEGIIIGIDATNVRAGGGLTHLIELLRCSDPQTHGFERIVIWLGDESSQHVEDRAWLVKRKPDELSEGLIRRSLWQRRKLSQAARDEGCTILFVPGGTFMGDFYPVVTMSQNLLPFEFNELRRFGWSFMSWKLLLLRFTQARSFQRASGVIFLTEFARKTVLSVTGDISGSSTIVAHGVNPRFDIEPRDQKNISKYSDSNPLKVLYVSIVDQYKHQWHVVEAVYKLRQSGVPISLDLVGPANERALERLEATLANLDAGGNWARYVGPVPFDDLHNYYAKADIGLFASSCENMPIILMETMAAGLPIACSDKGPMPEMLGDSGVYFNPEAPDEIAAALDRLVSSEKLREKLSRSSYELAKKFSWERCAGETFDFINLIGQKTRKLSNV